MPFVENMPDDENKDQTTQGPVSPVGGNSAVRLAPSAAVAPTGGNNPSQGGTSPNIAGGQFASLDKYITANQGQAEPLAGQITGNINKQYNTLAGQNTTTLNDIGNQVSSNAIPNANDIIAQETANPVSFASNAGNIPSFQKLMNANYSGPASAESTTQYQKQQSDINNAIAQGKNATTTEAGREGLLQQTEAVPTAGVTALDSAILSQSPTALSSVEKSYDPFSNLLTGLSGGAADINKNIAQTQGNVATANATANKQIADQLANLNTKIQGENTNSFNSANTNYQNLTNLFNKVAPPNQALIDAVNKDLAPGSGMGGTAKAAADMKALQDAVAQSTGQPVSPDQLQQLGITPGQWSQLTGLEQQLETPKFVTSGNAGMGSAWTPVQAVNLANWFQGIAPTQANFVGATPEEIAQGTALNQISGQNQFVMPQAGPAYQAPTFDFNGVLSALQQGLGQVNTGAQQTADQIAAKQLADYNASKAGGLFSSGIGGFLGAAANPISWVPNAINAVQNKPVSGTNMGQQYIRGV